MTDGSVPATDGGVAGLIEVVARLRGPGGCPWDAEQTHESLVRYLVEECWELVEAIESGDPEAMREELGDVLYQVLFHADLAAHTAGEGFTVDDVADTMSAKMVGRHPHVFGEARAETAADVVAVWEDLKSAEKPTRSSVLDGVPQGMPALALADKVLGKAERVGVLRGEAPPVPVEDEEELGGLLLAIVASARHRGLDAERALRTTLRAFQQEIRALEAADAD